MNAARDDGNATAYTAEQIWAVGRLIAGVVHEINNPLTSAGGLADLLRSEVDDETARGDLETITEEITRAVNIVRNLRAFAIHPDDEAKLCSLDRLAAQVVETRGYESRGRGLHLESDLGAADRAVWGAPPKMLLLILMLVLRAETRLLAEEGEPTVPRRIVVRTSASPEHVTLAVEDNSLVAAADADPTLAACAAAAAELDGDLTLDGAPGGGSLVTVTFPAAREA